MFKTKKDASEKETAELMQKAANAVEKVFEKKQKQSKKRAESTRSAPYVSNSKIRFSATLDGCINKKALKSRKEILI